MAETSIAKIRERYPQYDDLSDRELAEGLHKKHYSDMPFEDFAERVGLAAPEGDVEVGQPTIVDRAADAMLRDDAPRRGDGSKYGAGPDIDWQGRPGGESARRQTEQVRAEREAQPAGGFGLVGIPSVAPGERDLRPQRRPGSGLTSAVGATGPGLPSPGADTGPTEAFVEGARQGTLSLYESFYRTPETLKRFLVDLPNQGADMAIRALGGEPEALNPRVNVTTGPVGEFFDEQAEAFQREIEEGGNREAAAELQRNAEAANEALAAALDGDFGPARDVLTNPNAWAGFIGQAVPSLGASIASGGSAKFITWMEGMEAAKDAEDFEERTGVSLTPAQFARAVAQIAAANAMLEKAGVDQILKPGRGSAVRRLVTDGLAEGATEGTQEFSANVGARTYDPERGLSEGVLAGAMGGFGSGAAAGGGLGALEQAARAEQADDGARLPDGVFDADNAERFGERLRRAQEQNRPVELTGPDDTVLRATPEGEVGTERQFNERERSEATAREEMGLGADVRRAAASHPGRARPAEAPAPEPPAAPVRPPNTEPQDVLRPDNTPFRGEGDARLYAGQQRLDGYRPVEIAQGQWVLRRAPERPPEPLPSDQEIAQQESRESVGKRIADLERARGVVRGAGPRQAIDAELERLRKQQAEEQPKLTPQQRAAARRTVNPGQDDLATAIRKLGGIDTDLENDWSGRLTHVGNERLPGLPKLERPGKGRSLDDLAETLYEDGYLQSRDATELAQRLEQVEAGTPVYSLRREQAEQERDAREAEAARQVGADAEPDSVDLDEVMSAWTEYAEQESAPGEQYEADAYDPQADEFHRVMTDLARAAQDVDANTAEAILERAARAGTPDAEVVAQLLDVIRGGQRDGAQSEGVDRPRADEADAGEAAPGEERGQADEARSAPELTLTQQAPATTPPRRREEQEDAFGGRSEGRQAQVDADARQRRREAEAPPAESEEGIFSGGERQVDIDEAANQAATSPTNDTPEPTDAQKEAGNYKVGRVSINGLDISIENPAGSRRRPEWPPLTHHYGYIRGTEGRDGDHVDVFLTDQADNADLPVFVVDQVDPETRRFDEHKAMLGFADEKTAHEGYLANYEDGWQGLGNIRRFTLDEFKQWLQGDTTRRVTRQNEEGARDEDAEVRERRGRYGTRGQRERARAQAQGREDGDLFSDPSATVTIHQAKDSDTDVEGIERRVRQVETRRLPIGVDQVSSAADAAHVIAQIRKSAQETLVAVVTDVDGNVLNVIEHALGGTTSASVYPDVLAGAIFDTRGAAQVWMAHNHPSGITQQSRADEVITRRMFELLRGSGVEFHGGIVVAPGAREATLMNADGDAVEFEITAAPRSRGQARVTRREVRQVPRGRDMVAITSPSEAREVAPGYRGDGVILLDNRQRVAGWLPMSPSEMSRLRTGDTGTGVGRLLRAIGQTNAAAMIAKFDGPWTMPHDEAARNLMAFSREIDVRVLDGIVGDVSMAEAGTFEQEIPSPFFSRRRGTPETVRVVRAPEDVVDIPAEELWSDTNRFLRENVQGQSFEMADGTLVEVRKGGRGKVLSVGRRDYRRMAAARALPDLLRNAVRLRDAAPDRRGRPDIKAVETAVSAIEVSGRTHAVRLTLRRDQAGGRSFYTLAGYEIVEPAGGTVGVRHFRAGAMTQGAGSEISVGTLVAAINSSDPVFSRNYVVAPRMQAGEAKRIASGIMDGWSNAPGVSVVQAEAELPLRLQRHIAEAGAGGEVRGVYWRGRVYVVADNIRTRAEVEETILHEVVGHHGLRGLLGDDINPILDQVYLSVGRRGLQSIADEYGLDLGDISQRRQAAEEHLAHLTESHPQSKVWDRFVRMFVRWMRRMGFRIRLTGAEIRDLLLRSKRFVESGEIVRGTSVTARHGVYRGTEHSEAVYNRRGERYASARSLVESWRPRGVEARVSERAGILRLHNVTVRADLRGDGLGSRFMEALTRYADETGQRIGLTPVGDFGSDPERLRQWYRRFGFVNNQGRNRDFEIMESMVREPREDVAFQRVFHGTPHRFDRFSLEAIDTGEGAQAYGWGLYFAGRREIAEFYRDSIASGGASYQGQEVTTLNQHEYSRAVQLAAEAVREMGRPQSAVRALRQDLRSTPAGDPEVMALQDAIALIEEGAVRPAGGSIYQASIPDDNELLDWDAPLSEQPEKVQEALAQIEESFDPETRGSLVYDRLKTTMGSAQAASQALQDAGIPGLRYLDAGSRGYRSLRWAEGAPTAGYDRDTMAIARNYMESNRGSKPEAVRKLRRDAEASGSKAYSDAADALQQGDIVEDFSRNYVIWDEDVVTVEAVNDELIQAEEAEGGEARFSRRRDRGDIDPVLAEALKRAGLGRKRGPIGEWAERMQGVTYDHARSYIREMNHALLQGSLDRFHGIKRAELKHLGNLPAEQSAYVAARLSTGIASTMRAILHHGAPQWRDGIISKVEGSKGLLDVLEPVKGDLETFLGWMVARRAQRLMREGRENLFEQQHIDALIQAGERSRHFEHFEAVAAELDAFKKRVLDVAEEAGLLDPDTRGAWDQADYIPFYRVAEAETVAGPRSRQSLSGQTSGIRTLRGGTARLNDPLENLIMNFTHLMDASMKNHAIRQVRVNMEGTGILERVTPDFKQELVPLEQVKARIREQGGDPNLLPPEALRGMAKLWAMKAPSDPDVVRIMEGGKAAYYKVTDPLLLKSLTAVRAESLNFMGMGALRAFKRILTRGVTADPAFMARNFLRDMLHAWTINEDHFRLGVDSIRGVTKTLRETGGSVDMMFAGGSFLGGYVNATDPGETARAMRGALRQKGYDAAARKRFVSSVVDTPARWWETYTRIGDAVENASREAVYEAALKAGKTRAQAVFEAKDLMDYSMRGDHAVVQFFADSVAFLNARAQGLYKLGREGALRPQQIAARGSMIALASLALLARNWNDERYEDLEEWDKDTYWHVFLPEEYVGEKVAHVRIPKPFEVGVLFGTIPERMARNILGRDDAAKTGERLLWSIRETFAFQPVPQAFVPILELWSNESWFTNAPIEGMSDRGKLPGARYSAYTSATAKAVGRLTGQTIGVSPKQLEHLWRGYTGSLGMYALGVADTAVRAMNDAPPRPEWRIDDMPVVRSFLRAEPARSTRYMTEFYELYTDVNQIYRTVREYRRNGNEEAARALLKENLPKLQARDALRGAAERNSAIRRHMEEVYRSEEMTPAEKRREIDELLTLRNDNTKETMQSVRRFFEEVEVEAD